MPRPANVLLTVGALRGADKGIVPYIKVGYGTQSDKLPPSRNMSWNQVIMFDYDSSADWINVAVFREEDRICIGTVKVLVPPNVGEDVLDYFDVVGDHRQPVVGGLRLGVSVLSKEEARHARPDRIAREGERSSSSRARGGRERSPSRSLGVATLWTTENFGASNKRKPARSRSGSDSRDRNRSGSSDRDRDRDRRLRERRDRDREDDRRRKGARMRERSDERLGRTAERRRGDGDRPRERSGSRERRDRRDRREGIRMRNNSDSSDQRRRIRFGNQRARDDSDPRRRQGSRDGLQRSRKEAAGSRKHRRERSDSSGGRRGGRGGRDERRHREPALGGSFKSRPGDRGRAHVPPKIPPLKIPPREPTDDLENLLAEVSPTFASKQARKRDKKSEKPRQKKEKRRGDESSVWSSGNTGSNYSIDRRNRSDDAGPTDKEVIKPTHIKARVTHANKLPVKGDSSEFFVVVSYGNSAKQTEVKGGNSKGQATWNHTFAFPYNSRQRYIDFRVFQKRALFLPKKLIGCATVSLELMDPRTRSMAKEVILKDGHGRSLDADVILGVSLKLMTQDGTHGREETSTIVGFETVNE